MLIGPILLFAMLSLPIAGCGLFSGDGPSTVAVDLKECADWVDDKLPEVVTALSASDTAALEDMAQAQGLGFVGCLVGRAIADHATALSKLTPAEREAALRLLEAARIWLADHGLHAALPPDLRQRPAGMDGRVASATGHRYHQPGLGRAAPASLGSSPAAPS